MLARVRQLLNPPPRELEPREAYRLWAPAYPPYSHNLLMEIEQRGVLALLPDVRGKRVLDLACGSARYARLLRARGAHVVGLDLSFEMLERAEGGIPRVQGELCALPLAESSADGIVCGLAVGHVRNLVTALREMARVLKPGGTLVYSDFHAAGDALGWKRTFSAGGHTYAVTHFPRTEAEQRAACADARLNVKTVQSLSIPPDLAQTDPQAATFRARWGDTPLVLVVLAQRGA